MAPAFRCRYSGARERCGWQKENIQRIEFYGYRTDAKAAAMTPRRPMTVASKKGAMPCAHVAWPL